MTEILPALGADLALSDDMGRNVAEIVPFECNDEGASLGLWSKEAFKTKPQSGETAAPVRGRGRPAGPHLKILLTQSFPDGATAETLFEAGFRGDLAAALKRGDIREQDGRYVWIAVLRPEAIKVTEPRTLSNPPAPVPLADLAHLNKEELRAQPFRFEEISLDKIKIASRRRVLDQAKVDAIADSMDRIGLQTPITVHKADNDEFELGAGLHRHAAAKSLSWTKILCRVVQMDDLSRQLWEIDENLCRAELNELERGEHLAARKKIYEQLYPETRNVNERGGPGRGNKTTAESAPVSFTHDTASRTGLSERTIQQSIHRAEHIVPEVRDAVRDIPEIAEKGVELDALAKLPPALQAVVVAKVKRGDAPNIRAAAASSARNDEAEPAARKELTSNTATVEPPARRTMAQKWARHLADQMSVSELREVRDAIDEILDTAEHGGSDTVHSDEAH
jgi:ParB family chromosome partitioning protein